MTKVENWNILIKMEKKKEKVCQKLQTFSLPPLHNSGASIILSNFQEIDSSISVTQKDTMSLQVCACISIPSTVPGI